MFVYPDPPNLLIYLVTYLPRRDRFTHEDFVVGRELRRVVVHVFDFDVNAHFGVLVVTPCTHTHSRLKMMSVLLRTKKNSKQCQIHYRPKCHLWLACDCLSVCILIHVWHWLNTTLTVNISQRDWLSISQPLSQPFVIFDLQKKKKLQTRVCETSEYPARQQCRSVRRLPRFYFLPEPFLICKKVTNVKLCLLEIQMKGKKIK